MRSILIGLLLVAPLFAAAAQASTTPTDSFSVTPVELTFVDPALLRGGGSQGSLRVQNGFQEATNVEVTVLGDLAPWVVVEPSSFIMPADSARRIVVQISVPNEAANGNYSSLLRIRAVGVNSPSGSGAAMNVEVLPKLTVRVGGEQVISFATDSLQVADAAPQQPLEIAVHVINTGNVNAVPTFEVTIEDEDGNEVIRETLVGQALAPGSDEDANLATATGLPEGSYTARVKLGGMNAPALPPWTFDVYEAAANTAVPTGELVSLTQPPSVTEGSLATFTARFKNTGETAIRSTKLTIEILRNGVPFAIAQSDSLRTASNQEIVLDAHYQAREAGNYVARGYVTFDGVKSPVEEHPFVVEKVGATNGNDASGTAEDSDSKRVSTSGVFALVAIGVIVALASRRR